VKGTLYGTTIVGGTYRCCGTVFSFDIATGKETVLHSFGNTGDGDGPAAELVDIRGKLYGTTSMGGAGSCYFGCGTVFSVDRATGEEKVLYSFGAFSYDGQGPYSSVIDVNGKLYGTTSAGGTYGFGTVFSFDLRKGTETILFNFGRVYQTGASPETGLVDVNGVLYGTTSGGGNYGGGTVYAIETTGGKETILHSFGNGVDGYEPLGGLLNVNGTFYGTTNIGGSSNDICEYDLSSCGTIFKLKP
jgi:uncharacterized repeat protein (TIGR03803 family)